MAKVGLAFSGGGVRSAAFCSGVLRRLLQREANLDYLSCVSGGGYTGSAYMDWKYRHGKQDNKKWHFKFFDNLRGRSGIFCDWQRPLHGMFDCTVLFCMPLFVTLVVPIILWTAYACPLAYAVDFLAGDIIRGGIITHCDSAELLVNETVQECTQRREKKAVERFLLFGAPLLLAMASYLIAPMIPGLKNASSFLTTAFAVIFGLLFLPWFFHDVLEFIPTWMKVLIILPSVVLWFSFPVMRRNATLVVIVYFYAYVIVYRVYRESFPFLAYNDHFFAQQLWISGLLLWISPFLGTVQQRVGHIYNRYVTVSLFNCSQTPIFLDAKERAKRAHTRTPTHLYRGYRLLAKLVLVTPKLILCLITLCGRRGGLVVIALDSGLRYPGSSQGRVTVLCSWAPRSIKGYQ